MSLGTLLEATQRFEAARTQLRCSPARRLVLSPLAAQGGVRMALAALTSPSPDQADAEAVLSLVARPGATCTAFRSMDGPRIVTVVEVRVLGGIMRVQVPEPFPGPDKWAFRTQVRKDLQGPRHA